IAGVDVNTGRPLNRIIIPRNSRLPASRRQKFVTKAANQRSVDVKIVEGENEDPRYCIPIGKCIATLSPDLPARTEVLVTCRVSTNGTLSVSCVVPLTQESAHAEIRRDGLLELESLPIWRDRLLRGVSHAIEETPDLPMVAPVASPDRTDLDEVTRRIDYLCQLIGERAMTASLPPVMRKQQESLRKAQREYTAIRYLLTEVRRQLAKSQDNLDRTRLQSAAAAIRSYLAESEKLFIYSRIAFGAGCVSEGCVPTSVAPEAAEAVSLKETLQNWQLN
ncbi:MAG: Hsp70 family protein, partial [Planctomycetales bacterium]|nr:Hsp70 family protein [Planctomycetales bacterium]